MTPLRQVIGQAPARLAAGEGHRAILTSASSKFPPKIVLPPGVVAPAPGSTTTPVTSASTPWTTLRVPLDADSFAEASSSEYGGAAVAVAIEIRRHDRG